MSNAKQLTYVEDFRIDLSSTDALKSYGAQVDNGVLRGLRECETVEQSRAYLGIAGASSKYLFVYSNASLWRYDGENATHIQRKSPRIDPYSKEARYDIYRDIAYLAFDDDGIIRFDENADTVNQRWAYLDAAQDIAVVNERIIMLTDNGRCLRFAECGKRLYSDVENRNGRDVTPVISLPTVAQAICRADYNTLYVLGDTCYKVIFSANEQDIKLTQIASGVGKAVRASVARVGNRIVFATEAGLRCLKNDVITPLFDGLSNVVSNFSFVKARAWRGEYALTVPYGEGLRTYLLNVDDERCSALLWKDASDPTEFGGKDYLLTANGKLVCVKEDVFAPARFVRTRIDFGSGNYKYLRRLNVTTKYDVEISVTYDNGVTNVYRFKGSDEPQTLNIFGKSRAFGIEIRSQGQIEVSALSIKAETYKEDYYGN